MKIYLTLHDAAEQYNIDLDKLQELVDQGKIRANKLKDDRGEKLIVQASDVRNYVAERDVTREQFAHLKDQPILLSEAAEKYGFPVSSLWRWIGQEHIHVIKRDGKRVFLDEADVAYARALADIKELRSGQALFGRITNR